MENQMTYERAQALVQLMNQGADLSDEEVGSLLATAYPEIEVPTFVNCFLTSVDADRFDSDTGHVDCPTACVQAALAYQGGRGPTPLRSGTGRAARMMTTPQPPLYQLDAETLGYAIGRLLRHTSLRSYRSLGNAARAFLTDAGISVAALSAQELEVLFRNVGRGYAKPLPTSKRKETTYGPDHD